MGTRYTRKDAEKAVERLADALGLPYGHYVTLGHEPEDRPEGRYKRQLFDGRWITTQPNALELSYQPTYGGCVIVQIADDGGTWERHPFTSRRMRPREFVQYVDGIIAGISAGRAS